MKHKGAIAVNYTY